MTVQNQTRHNGTGQRTADGSAATFTRIETPIGTLTLAGGDAGLRMVWFGAQNPHWATESTGPLHPVLAEAVRQLEEYFAGRRTAFDLPLDVRGPDFQRQAWLALASIPYGRTVSYSEQARRIGAPGAARAVGAANGRNPLPVILPCHRVIGANGALTGFGGGLGAKRWLLEHEMLVSSRDRATPEAGALF
jgi:methylated-DNA-[protein]-cysteine S-methyltransferase